MPRLGRSRRHLHLSQRRERTAQGKQSQPKEGRPAKLQAKVRRGPLPEDRPEPQKAWLGDLQKLSRTEIPTARHTTHPPVPCLGRTFWISNVANPKKRRIPGRPGGRFWHGFAVRRPPVWPPGDRAGVWSISCPGRYKRPFRWTVGAEEMRDDDHTEFERLLSPEDVARACGLSRRAVYRAIARGELRAARLCHRLRVHPAELERWIAEETCAASPHSPTRSRRRTEASPGGLRVLLDEAAEG